jgi:ABC-type branched-subunit amino acid transport system substrate-binding protein
MRPPRLQLRRRELLIGLGGLITLRPSTAIACHATDHPPCRVLAFVPKSGSQAQLGRAPDAGIRAMVAQLREIDPNGRGRLEVVIIDSESKVEVTINGIRKEMQASKPPAAIIIADLTLPPEAWVGQAAEFKIPFVLLTTGTSKSRSEWICQLAPSATQIARGLLGYLAANANREPINIVTTALRAPRADDFAIAIVAAGSKVGVRVSLPDNLGQDWTTLEAEILKAGKNSAWMVSMPVAAVPRLIEVLRKRFDQQGPIAVDTGLADPNPVLRSADARVVALCSFSPELVKNHSPARDIEQRMQKSSDLSLTPAAAVAATATQVLAAAVIKAQGSDHGTATRDALRAVSIKREELIVPWAGVEFDRETFQNQGARVVALGRRDNQVVTIWSAQ